MSALSGTWLAVDLDAGTVIQAPRLAAESAFEALCKKGANAILIEAPRAARHNFVQSKDRAEMFAKRDAERVKKMQERRKAGEDLRASQQPAPPAKKAATKKAARERQTSGNSGN